MFHTENGLYFERVENKDGMGDVRITKKFSADANAQIDFQVQLPYFTWESVIASMSAAGEQASYEAAKAFHRSIGSSV